MCSVRCVVLLVMSCFNFTSAETASIDPLRNAVQRYKEMQFLVAVDNAATSTHSRVPLKVQSVSQIRELTMDLVEYC